MIQGNLDMAALTTLMFIDHFWTDCVIIINSRVYSHSALSLLIFTECGGKNFHFVHNSAELESVISGTVRSAFEYGGQKCSACSRMYVPESKWPKIKEGMLEIQKQIKVGSPLEADSFLSAVIDDKVHVQVYSSPKRKKNPFIFNSNHNFCLLYCFITGLLRQETYQQQFKRCFTWGIYHQQRLHF